MSSLKEKKEKVAHKMMGKQNHLKPVTKSDKEMSKRHLKHRAELDDMDEDDEKTLKKSMKYNEKHKEEHEKALEKCKKKLEKK